MINLSKKAKKHAKKIAPKKVNTNRRIFSTVFDGQLHQIEVNIDKNYQYTAEVLVDGARANYRIMSKLKGRPTALVDPQIVLYNELERQKLDYERFGEC